MRLWHYALLPYLPDAQFRGQLREVVAIMRDWRDKGVTNHLLINRAMDYSKHDLEIYFNVYEQEYHRRYGKWLPEKGLEFVYFGDTENRVVLDWLRPIFDGWHNKEYLRVCMANLYEKWKFGKGKSRITDEEWQKLSNGYKEITGEDYII